MTDNEQNLLARAMELADYVRTLEITDARLTKMLAEIAALKLEVEMEDNE